MYNLKEVEDNIALVCSVCTQILSELPEDVKLGGFLSEQS